MKNLPLSMLQINEEKHFMDKYLERKAYALTSIHKASCLLDPNAQACYLVSFARSSYFSEDNISPIIDHEQLLVEIANAQRYMGKRFHLDCFTECNTCRLVEGDHWT